MLIMAVLMVFFMIEGLDVGVDEDFDHIDYDVDAAIREQITFICKNREFEIISSRV